MKRVPWLLAVCVFLLADAADAAIHRGLVEGQIGEIVDASLGSHFNTGEVFRFSYVFDDAAPDTETGTSDVGRYDLISASATIGSVAATSSPGEEGFILVVEGIPDRYEVIWYFEDVLPGYAEFGIGFSLWDQSSAVFPEDDLPIDVALSDFSPHSFGVWTREPAVLLRGELESVTFEVIPEPTTFMLLGIGFLGVVRRRTRHTSSTC